MSGESKIMTVQELIDILSNVEDPDLANIGIYLDGMTYTIKSIRQFSISPDVTFTIEPIILGIVASSTVKRKHEKMVKDKIDERKQF